MNNKLIKQLRREATAMLNLQDIFNTNDIPAFSQIPYDSLIDDIDEEYNENIALAMFPNKTRANRRKQTAKKHQRAEKIAKLYTTDDNKNNPKKAIRYNKSLHYGCGAYWDWTACSCIYKKNENNYRRTVSNGLAEYNYQQRVVEFYKLVDDYLTV